MYTHSALGGQGSPGEALVTVHLSVLLLMAKQREQIEVEENELERGRQSYGC